MFRDKKKFEKLKKQIDIGELTHVHLSNMDIYDDEISDILQYIQQNKPGMTYLDLDNNHITDKSTSDLFKYLQNFPHLKVISIQFNQIDRTGALQLFQLKRVHPTLDIAFRGNKITDVGEMHRISQEALELAATREYSFKNR